MHKSLQYGESWELATLLVENTGKRSQLVPRLSKPEFMPEYHFSRSIRTKVTNKTLKYVKNSRSGNPVSRRGLKMVSVDSQPPKTILLTQT